MKKAVLCADDYGQTPAIGRGIRQLAELNRISATSCLVTSTNWKNEATLLKPFIGRLDIGLHFNLTQGCSLSGLFKPQFPSLSQLIIQTLLRKIKPLAIQAELEAQLDCFVSTLGILPNYIDGHQHIQHLPQVRDALVAVYQKRLKGTDAYIRSLYEPNFYQSCKKQAQWKIWVMQLTGAIEFEKILKSNKIPHNDSCTGVYNFQNAEKFAEFFPTFLQQVEQNTLIVCHPGAPVRGPDGSDPLYKSRPHELTYLLSRQFVEDCQKYQIEITRFQEVACNTP